MTSSVIQIILIAALLAGVLGAPLLPDETDNQFLRLKRRVFSWDDEEFDYRPYLWMDSALEQYTRFRNYVRDTAQYYVNLDIF
uniref:Uncharacterized protein C3orf85 homolog n=1 Tax=Geotrypetes seraphini TaxID=260995 RepID=A0A6P8QHS8_GEOSA|nr:uncharacterized protein C3orf85 homolog [Geotrypetes seraphini]